MELTFAQNFALLALNAQDSLHMTVAKKVSLRCVFAAVLLELYLKGLFPELDGKIKIEKDVVLADAGEDVVDFIFGKRSSLEIEFSDLLGLAEKLGGRKLRVIETAMADSLKGLGLLEEIPNLLGCDLLYYSASISMREYRSDSAMYQRIAEELRAEVLEDGEMTEEAVMMFWLIRECGCVHELFSEGELPQVFRRMDEVYIGNPLAKRLLPVQIHRVLELNVKRFLKSKKEAMSSGVGLGVDFVFPVFERSQSVFIDTEAWFSSKEDRLRDVLARLAHFGHHYTVLREGAVPLIKIDNIIYEAIPDAVAGKVPIQGVRLRRYPVY